MKHLPFQITPITRLMYYEQKYSIKLYCKRDDLFSQAGGGSKARMLQYILYPLVQNKVEVLITAGGPCSNYNRAAALLCAKYGIKMKLVSYTDIVKEYETSLNHFISGLAGVEFIYCKKGEVPQIIQQVVLKTESTNCSYRYLYGGGKSLEGVYAYYDAVRELREQSLEDYDLVFVACGTGTTLSGICAGMQEYFPKAQVHAISVARPYIVEKPVLDEDMKCLNAYLGKKYDYSNMYFHDEFLCGGYDLTSERELEVIRECISHEGMLIDPIYSGKAFFGMSELLPRLNAKGRHVLFWNTGGLFNLLSGKELFYDKTVKK